MCLEMNSDLVRDRERGRGVGRERERLLLGETVMELHTHQSIFWCKLTCGYLSATEMCSVVYHQCLTQVKGTIYTWDSQLPPLSPEHEHSRKLNLM